MSFPNIPNITPTISLRRTDVVNLLLASIALEELGLAHVVNAEAEKLQAVIGTLPGVSIANVDVATLLSVNESVHTMLKTVIKKEMLLEFKLEEVLKLLSTSSTTSVSVSTSSTSSSTSTSSSSTSTSSTTVSPLFLFGDIASATGKTDDITVTSVDDAFYTSVSAPVISGYNITQTPIVGVPTNPQPSIKTVKQVSVDGGHSWDDANDPLAAPLLPPGSKPWFLITVSNNGNVPLSDVTITDPSLHLITIVPTLVNGAGVQFLAEPL